MLKLTGYETDTWLLSAHEVEVLQDAADQWDEGKNELFLDFDESTLLIENCDGAFFMRVFDPGKGTERAFALIQHEENEFQEVMKKFDAINEKDMFSYRADKARNAFEKWLFCDGSDNEKIAFWNMFKESVNA